MHINFGSKGSSVQRGCSPEQATARLRHEGKLSGKRYASNGVRECRRRATQVVRIEHLRMARDHRAQEGVAFAELVRRANSPRQPGRVTA